MAETTLLRSSANVRNASPNATASRPHAQLTGALPQVNVNMNAGGPTVQGGNLVKQGVTILPPKAGTQRFMTGGLPNQPAKQGVVILPPKEQRGAATSTPLTADQLLLCRHLVDKYLAEQLASADAAQVKGATIDSGKSVEGAAADNVEVADSGKLAGTVAADNIKLAEAAIVAIDAALVALTASAAMAAAAAVQPPPSSRPRMVAGGPRQIAASAAPRRVARPAPPPVAVRMDAGKPIIETDPPVTAPMDVAGQPIVQTDQVQSDAPQG